MLLNGHETIQVVHVADADLTVGKTNIEEISKVIERNVLDRRLLGHLIVLDRPLLSEVTEIEVAGILALGAHDELVLLLGDPSDGRDSIWVPILLLIFVVLLKLASESESPLPFFLLLVLLLVLLHLELHHFHFPLAA